MEDFQTKALEVAKIELLTRKEALSIDEVIAIYPHLTKSGIMKATMRKEVRYAKRLNRNWYKREWIDEWLLGHVSETNERLMR